jgi:2-polyprenyl-3-methyl-5-hydroxy-6-metoxy-1,4-benzoquinol methylase
VSEAREELRMLDALLAGGGDRWNEFFGDRARPCPFFVEWPDENLVAWFNEGLLTPGRVLELGCGHGRNATYLASLGCSVDAVDFSARAIEWAKERAASAGAAVSFQCCSVFDATFTEGCFGADFLWALLAAKDGSARFSQCSP